MSEKEQTAALKLLQRWLDFEAAADAAASFEAVGAMLQQRQGLLEETRSFLRLPVVAQDVAVGPESHGERRG